MKINIREFLLNAALCGVRVGDTKEKVLGAFGFPDSGEGGGVSWENSDIWFFNNVQFGFTGGEVDCITIWVRHPIMEISVLPADISEFSKMSMADVSDWAAAHGFSVGEEQSGGQFSVTMSNGCSVVFARKRWNAPSPVIYAFRVGEP